MSYLETVILAIVQGLTEFLPISSSAHLILVPAFLGVPLRTYFLATLFGIIPGTVVYVQVGAGLGSIFESGETLTLTGVLTPDVMLGLVGLAVLSLLPIVYKKFKERRDA